MLPRRPAVLMMAPGMYSKASGAAMGLIAVSCSLVSTPTEVPVCSAVAGVAVADTTTVCGVVARFSCTLRACVCGTATCSDCSANPGASTTARYCPSGRLGKIALPSPAVVCTPTPPLSLTRNRLICTPETRSPEGLCTDTLRSAARTAVQDSSAASNARTMNITLLLCTRKGLVTIRAGLLACELRFASRTAAGPSRLHSGLPPKLAYSCAAARALHPLPSSAQAERANASWQGTTWTQTVQDRTRTVLSPKGGVNRGAQKTAPRRTRSRVPVRLASRHDGDRARHRRRRAEQRCFSLRVHRHVKTVWE